MANATTISLQNRVDGKLLYEALDEIEQKKLNGAERKKGITEIINRYAPVQ